MPSPHTIRNPTTFWIGVCLFVLIAFEFSSAAEQSFKITFSKSIHEEPFTGRVYLFFSQVRAEPRTGPGWFRPEQFLSVEVQQWLPETPLVISSTTRNMKVFPVSFEKLNLKRSRVQAVARFDPWDRNIGTGVGNGYSKVKDLSQVSDNSISLRIESLVAAGTPRESRWAKPVHMRSELLSKFHQRDVLMKAMVLLPESYYNQPSRNYPVIYSIPGFGGTSAQAFRQNPVRESNEQGVEFIRVTLDPGCPLGHHVFANSENNGPVGDALIRELIPHLEKNFRMVSKPTARFLTGHSSGGWSSLWLQVTYPESFGGTWSTAPDPVDFRDFQRVNLYQQGENLFKDDQGNRRPLARVQNRVLIWYDDFSQMEDVLGHGGQLHSFEAVFSPKGKDGKPQSLWNRKTGAIDQNVALTWKKYDIRLILEENWNDLQPKLAGKIHVIMGTEDTFYLEGATILLQKSQAKLQSDAEIELVRGRNHMNLLTPDIVQRIRKQMVSSFLKHHPDGGRAKGK